MRLPSRSVQRRLLTPLGPSAFCRSFRKHPSSQTLPQTSNLPFRRYHTVALSHIQPGHNATIPNATRLSNKTAHSISPLCKTNSLLFPIKSSLISYTPKRQMSAHYLSPNSFKTSKAKQNKWFLSVFHEVQTRKLFPDSKTFPDMTFKDDPEQIYENNYKSLDFKHMDSHLLKTWVIDNYLPPGADQIDSVLVDFIPEPEAFKKIKDPFIRKWVLQLVSPVFFLSLVTSSSLQK